MSTDRPLTDKERAFCRHYVEQGCFNAKGAAIKAGYGAASAHVTASQLLKKPMIQREIERLLGGPKGAAIMVIDAAADAAKGARMAASTYNPEAVRMAEEADADLAAGLSRAYVVAGLIDNFEMALGRKSKRLTRVITKRTKAADGAIETTYEAVQIDVFEVDHAGANRAGELLLQQCAPDAPDAPEGQEEAGNAVSPLLEAFRAGRVFEVHPEKAKAG